MKSECPFCGFQSSVYAVQMHIDQNHTSSPPLHPTSSPPLQQTSSSPIRRSKVLPVATQGPSGGAYGVPVSDLYPVKERHIVTRRYPVDEPSWIKCGVPGCGQYVTQSSMNDHLDMHDMQAEEEERARRLAMLRPSGAGGPGGKHPSPRALKRIGYGDDYDAASMMSGGSGESRSSSAASSAASGKSSGGKHGKNGSGGNGSGSGKDRKSSSRKDSKGSSSSSDSGKAKDGSGRSTKSSSSSVVSSSSKARSGGGSGSRGGSKGNGANGGGDGRNGNSGGNGPDGGPGGNGPNGNGSGPGSSMGGPRDPFMTGGPADSPDMGGLELQLAKLLLANRANPNSSGAMLGPPPGAVQNMANMVSPNPASNNPYMSPSPSAANDLMQAIQKSMRPQSRDPNPYIMDQRVPSEAANLLAALVFSRAGT